MDTWQPRWISPRSLAASVFLLAVAVAIALYFLAGWVGAVLGFVVGLIGSSTGGYFVYQAERGIFRRR